jgi:hypothetical protein
MNAWCDELSRLALGIIRGHEMPGDLLAINPNYSAATAIGIYRNNYLGNLHDALAGAYPVIEQLVGRDFFRLLARRYIEQHPSRSGNLHHYGAGMAGFIAAFEPAQGLPYLPDVAALEWACHRTYFADEAATIDIVKLAQLSPAQYSGLILHTTCHLVRSNYPVSKIWHAHQPGAPGDFHIDLASGPCNALVSRRDDIVRVSELADADASWLQAIQAGIPLGEATAATMECFPDFDLQAVLVDLAAHDALNNFNLGAKP